MAKLFAAAFLLIQVILAMRHSENGTAVEAESSENPAVVAGVMAANRAREAAARRQREEAARRQRAREEENRKRRLREEAHRTQHLRNCMAEEVWGAWGDCSATCGGGVQAHGLVSRTIIQSRDAFGYGEDCKSHSQEVQACGIEMCDIDCSRVDIGNHVPATGVTKAWVFEAEGDCVFQVWQRSPDEKSFRLLGETSPQGKMPSDPTVYDFSSATPLAIHEGLEQISLGFRSCHVRSKSPPAGGSAKICKPSTHHFDKKRQLRSLSRLEEQFLNEQFMSAAKTLQGLAQRKVYVTGELIPPVGDRRQPHFSLGVEMSPRPPPAPKLSDLREVADDIQITAISPGASSFEVLLQRQHGSSKNQCDFVALSSCEESPSSPCVTGELLMRHLPFASTYKVVVKSKNAEGLSLASEPLRFSTRAQAGVPLASCEVKYWSCETSDGMQTLDFLPVGDGMQCQIAATPLPICWVPRRTNLWLVPKCQGKAYWKTCSAVLKASANCKIPDKANICTHQSNMNDDGIFDESKAVSPTCKSPGCSKSVLPGHQKRCCCTPGHDELDQCACATDCKELGLVEAADASISCQH